MFLNIIYFLNKRPPYHPFFSFFPLLVSKCLKPSTAVWFLLLVPQCGSYRSDESIQVIGYTVQYILQPPILMPPLYSEATEAHSSALVSASLCSNRGLFGPCISFRNPVSGQEHVTFAVKWHKCSCRRKRDTEKCRESKLFFGR